jgi:hypothetical protein
MEESTVAEQEGLPSVSWGISRVWAREDWESCITS